MKIRNLIKGDITFQVKYGFYFVYAVFTLFYILVLYAIPLSVRREVAYALIYTDPAAMGLFFMGAIVLLEKSQRVLDSIAVSPVKVSEYIISKVVSLGVIAALVGAFIAALSGAGNIPGVILGTFLGSIIFSLLGLMIAAKINSLNQFVIATVPFEIISFLPPVLYLFGYHNKFMLIHPGVIIIRMFNRLNQIDLLQILILSLWIILIYELTYHIIKKMFLCVGGIKL
jgi:fluoroquinolone transport system permease protein